jgi:pre-60S factor REI1
MTCRVGFRDSDLQRDHYKSDWHRYNLKRKIVNLPPVTAENFADRVAAQELLQVEASKDTSQYCTVCKKSYGNEKAFQSHILSKKHLELLLKTTGGGGQDSSSQSRGKTTKGEAAAAEGADNGSGPGVILSSSPGKNSPSLGGKKFPQSPQALIKSTFPGKGQKLGTEADDNESSDDDSWEEIEGTPIPPNACLFCSFESSDVEDNLEHMSIAHSFFIPDVEYCTNIEGLLEYLGCKVGEGMVCLWCNEKGKSFYDVQAVQQHMRDKGHCKMIHEGDAQFEYSDYYDFSSSYPEDARDVNPDEPYQQEQLRFNASMQLVLPSGGALGHRALRRYYR